MQRIILYPITLMLIIFTGWTSGFSETNVEPPDTLSLSSSIHEALAANPMMATATSRLKAAEERITQAQSGFYPHLYFTESYQRTNSPMWVFASKLNQEMITQEDFSPDILNDPSARDNFNSRLWVNWPIFDSGQSYYSLKMANAARNESAASLERTRQEVIFQTVEAYTSLLLARHSIEVIDQAIKTANAHLKIISKRFENGMVVKSDVLRAKVHLAELDQNRAIAKSMEAVARASLNSVMGRDTDIDILPSASLCQTPAEVLALSELIGNAVSHRPDLRQIEFMVQIAASEIDKSKSQHWPSFDVNGSYEFNTEEFDDTASNYTVGANITVNIFSGALISSRSREASHKRAEAQYQKEAKYRQIRLETEKAYYDLLSADKRIAASELAVENADEMLRIVENRYETGLVNIVSLLDAELALFRANNNYFNSLKDHIQARARLALATGTLDEHFE